MSENITCPSCGQEISAEAKFCRFCGASSEAVANAAASTDATEVIEAPVEDVQTPDVAAEASELSDDAVEAASGKTSYGVCPTCGAPQTKPNQRFCGSCGSTLDVASGEGFAAAASAAGAGFAGAASTASETFSKASSSLNDFMGASVDLDAVGAGFDASQYRLSGDDDEALVQAFAFFDKVYRKGSDASAEDGPDVVARQQLEPEEGDAAQMAEQDFYIRADDGDTHVSYELFAAGMSDELIPLVGMLTEETKTAASAEETKERLKAKVAMGEISQEAAVEKANA